MPDKGNSVMLTVLQKYYKRIKGCGTSNAHNLCVCWLFKVVANSVTSADCETTSSLPGSTFKTLLFLCLFASVYRLAQRCTNVPSAAAAATLCLAFCAQFAVCGFLYSLKAQASNMASTEETDKQIEIWKVKRVRQMMVVHHSPSCR
jgi:hypothetical protein